MNEEKKEIKSLDTKIVAKCVGCPMGKTRALNVYVDNCKQCPNFNKILPADITRKKLEKVKCTALRDVYNDIIIIEGIATAVLCEKNRILTRNVFLETCNNCECFVGLIPADIKKQRTAKVHCRIPTEYFNDIATIEHLPFEAIEEEEKNNLKD